MNILPNDLKELARRMPSLTGGKEKGEHPSGEILSSMQAYFTMAPSEAEETCLA